jgi:glucan phosphoethanolaminetransferase (alkaline phosphatase superfamily)
MNLNKFRKISFFLLLFFTGLLLFIYIIQSNSDVTRTYLKTMWLWLLIALLPIYLIHFATFWKEKQIQKSIANPLATACFTLLVAYGIFLLSFPIRAAFLITNIEDAIRIYGQPNWETLVFSIVLIVFYYKAFFIQSAEHQNDKEEIRESLEQKPLSEIKVKVVSLIANNRLDDAFAILLNDENKFDADTYNSFVMFSQQWKDITKQGILNITESESVRIRKAQISNGLLQTLSDF